MLSVFGKTSIFLERQKTHPSTPNVFFCGNLVSPPAGSFFVITQTRHRKKRKVKILVR